jgi:hypothetical protein
MFCVSERLLALWNQHGRFQLLNLQAASQSRRVSAALLPKRPARAGRGASSIYRQQSAARCFHLLPQHGVVRVERNFERRGL